MPEAHSSPATAYRRVLAHVTLGRHDALVVRQAGALAKAHGAELHLLHVADMEPTLDGGYCLTPGEEARAREAWAMLRLQGLARTLRGTAAECHVGVGRSPWAFAQFARDWMPDLVVTARETQHFAQGPWDTLIVSGPARTWWPRIPKLRPMGAKGLAAVAAGA